ncbi:MAG: preprotein translocase subunit SecY [Clostridiales Family XIII bacterium]|nr:preprotein translocase subunit SecY [Clostridiales Family XIII bacterium]
MRVFQTMAKAWNVPELRKKMIFTLLMLVVFRLGSAIPVPGINREAITDMFAGQGRGIFDLLDLFSGGSFSQMTVFALSITPYITASIILNLLTISIPRLAQLAREGTEGRKKITQITRYLTVILALLQAIGMTVGLFRSAVVNFNFLSVSLIVLTLTAGTAFLMWLGEQINEHGVGNGISLIIFAGIICRAPSAIRSALAMWDFGQGTVSTLTIILFIIFALIVVVGIVLVQEGQRRIPVSYAKKVVGRKMYGGQSSHIPVKVNQAGVIPVIFSMSLLQFPMTLAIFISSKGYQDFVQDWFSTNGTGVGSFFYAGMNILLIMFFTYFYTMITFNPVEVAENMRENGGFVPGIRPGKATVDYLQKVMMRVTFVGAVFLSLISTLPTLVQGATSLNIYFGGTSLLIAVGVALETMKQIEAQMITRNYDDGFLRR